jgi:hypothetical protein
MERGFENDAKGLLMANPDARPARLIECGMLPANLAESLNIEKTWSAGESLSMPIIHEFASMLTERPEPDRGEFSTPYLNDASPARVIRVGEIRTHSTTRTEAIGPVVCHLVLIKGF